MTTAPTDSRPEAPKIGGEREQLNGFLDFLRATVVTKAAGLTDEQARRPLVPSPLTTVAALLSHLRYAENYWFGIVLDGQDDPWRDQLTDDPDADFRWGHDAPLHQLVEDYQRQCEQSRRIVAARDLDAEGVTGRGQRVNVRWVLIHMIEETGRHAGHLDLLRELLDGSTGE